MFVSGHLFFYSICLIDMQAPAAGLDALCRRPCSSGPGAAAEHMRRPRAPAGTVGDGTAVHIRADGRAAACQGRPPDPRWRILLLLARPADERARAGPAPSALLFNSAFAAWTCS